MHNYALINITYTECSVNLNPDGSCKEGALPEDCCECDTTGNATHAFYKTQSGECKRKFSITGSTLHVVQLAAERIINQLE